MLESQAEGDPYYCAVAYTLNDLCDKGIVIIQDGKLAITDVESYYAIHKSAAKEVLALYEDSAVTEKKAGAWVKKRCTPNEKVMNVLDVYRRAF